tara:strand:- start:279 stop:467 length:189 start_codon:yes stop_codon:yes gene_type:complete
MLIIPVEKDNINKALKAFKIKFKKTGVLKEVRERKNYTKPTTKKRLTKNEAIRNLKKQQEDE